MSIVNSAARSSAARVQRYRARRRQGTRCIRVDVSQSDIATLVGRYYLPEEASRDPGAIKAAIEGLMADLAFDLETERANRQRIEKRVTAQHRDA